MALTPGTLLGPYEIVKLVGAGAMGEVYRARDPRFGREVAIKILPAAFAADAERVRRFEQEVGATGQLNHPNLLVVHDVGIEKDTPYLVCEVLEGETLHDRISAGPLPLARAIDYGVQILHGLAAAHARGIVHRDLKPGNLFLLRDGRVKILDFGIAKLMQKETSADASARAATVTAAAPGTDPDIVMGTVGYMSPEQVRGLPVDHRTDLFAFGAVLYEMITGKRAFRGTTPADTLTAILREDPPEIPQLDTVVPRSLDRLVRHCLEKEPEARFQSASDAAFALEAVRDASSSRPPVVRAPQGRRARALFPLIVAAAFAAGGAWLGYRAGSARGVHTASIQKVTFGRGILTGAGFAADGRSFLYSAEWDGKPPAIYAVDPQTPGSERTVLAGARLLSVSKQNELAILLETATRPHYLAIGTLARMPASGGAPRKLVENVICADWSPDGASLAAIREVGNRYQLEYPVGHVLYVSPGWISHIAVSPDGERVAILDHPTLPDDRGDLVTVDSKGRRRVVSAAWASIEGLAWAPQGDEIWFTAVRSGVHRSVYAVNRNGRVRPLITIPGGSLLYDVSRDRTMLLCSNRSSVGMRLRAPGASEEKELGWLDWSIPQDLSSDGCTVLFSEEGSGGGEHYVVALRDTSGSPPVLLGEGTAEDLSPDGAWVLVTRFWMNPPRIQIVPTGPGEARMLPPPPLENISLTSFFPDQKRILIVGNEPGHGSRAYVASIGQTGPSLALTPISPEGIRIIGTAVLSPDGRTVVGLSGDKGLTTISVEGGSPRRVPGTLPRDVPLGWSRDSKAILISTRGSGFPWKLDRVDLATGARSTVFVSQGPPDRAGVRPNSRIVAPDGHAYVYGYGRTLDELHLIRGLR